MSNRPFALLGVNSDSTLEEARGAVRRENLTWRSWQNDSGDGKISTTYNVKGWPTIYLIDHNGVIRHTERMRMDDMDRAIEKLVEEAEAEGMVAKDVAAEAALREFTSADGDFTITASFVDFKDGKAHLKTEDGDVIEVSMNDLSSEDQAFIRETLKARR